MSERRAGEGARSFRTAGGDSPVGEKRALQAYAVELQADLS